VPEVRSAVKIIGIDFMGAMKAITPRLKACGDDDPTDFVHKIQLHFIRAIYKVAENVSLCIM